MENLSSALWLANNTTLTAKQISELCPGVHELQAILIKSGTCNFGEIEPTNPIEAGVLSQSQIDQIASKDNLDLFQAQDIKRYIPKILRGYVPGAIIWLKQNYPHLGPKQIAFALGTTPKRVTTIIQAGTEHPVNPVSAQIFNEAFLRELVRQ
jgi:hypothetical protein